MRTTLPFALLLVALSQGRVFDTWFVLDQLNAYQTSSDSQVFHGGAASGHIAALSPTSTASLIVSQALRADVYRGKRVRFSAWLRTKDVVKSVGMGGVLFMRAEGGGSTLASYSTGNRPAGGTTDWTMRQIVLDIPAHAIGITFGFGMTGPGDLWIDDALLEVVGQEVPVSRAAVKAQPLSASKLRQQQAAYAKKPTQASNMDFERVK